MIYITTKQKAQELLESITDAIKQSGVWRNTKTTKLCDLVEFHSGDCGLPIVHGYESFYPDSVLESAEQMPPDWHEDKQIQIVQSNEDLLSMLEEYPEIAVYRKENNITTYRESGRVYVYVNWILDEHRSIFENYDAEINEMT